MSDICQIYADMLGSPPRHPLTAGGTSVGSAGSSAVVGAKKKQAMVIDLKEVIDLKQQAESSKREKNEKSRLEVWVLCVLVCVCACMYV